MTMITAIKKHTPWAVRRLSRKLKRRLRQGVDARLSCKAVFTRIYESNSWGGAPGEFFSGPGSDERTARPYTEAVCDFIARKANRSVVDLGCGDFRVGSRIASCGVDYTGVDIVDAVVDQNRMRYGNDRVRFQMLDIVEDGLPPGDLCLVREVFQHFSNAQISRVLPKLRSYRYVIVTDYQPPSGKLVPNRDKPHGGSTRLHDGSAIRLDQPPFNVENVELFLEVGPVQPIYDAEERLRSFLITNPSAAA